jgi:hypothetical protein
MTTKTWNDERTATLTSIAGSAEIEVSQTLVRAAAEQLDVTPRSVGAKLRKMGYSVEKASDAAKSKWPEAEEAGLRELLNQNDGEMTYAEIAAAFGNGQYSAKAIQGKVLSMELTGMVKKTEPQEVKRTYTEAEEATFLAMAAAGEAIEDIATALNKSIPSVRGKALSMSRQVEGFVTPKQRDSHATQKVDPVASIDASELAKMSVADIAERIGKSERGVKTILTRRGLVASDYDGAKKAAKNADKKTS